MSKFARIESAKDLIQDGVDRTVTGVESIHQSILDFPFAALERTSGEKTELDARVQNVRNAKTRAVSSIYGLVRQINDDVGELLSDLLLSAEDYAVGTVKTDADAPADASNDVNAPSA